MIKRDDSISSVFAGIGKSIEKATLAIDSVSEDLTNFDALGEQIAPSCGSACRITGLIQRNSLWDNIEPSHILCGRCNA